jgi:hypothetical protein
MAYGLVRACITFVYQVWFVILYPVNIKKILKYLRKGKISQIQNRVVSIIIIVKKISLPKDSLSAICIVLKE